MVDVIKALAASTHRDEVLQGIGGYAGLLRLPGTELLLAATADAGPRNHFSNVAKSLMAPLEKFRTKPSARISLKGVTRRAGSSINASQ